MEDPQPMLVDVVVCVVFRTGAMDVRRCTMCERLKEGDTLDVSGLTRWYAGYQMRCAVAVDEVGGLCVCC